MKVVFDIDGVMHPIMETTCKFAGVDIGKIDKYNIKECNKLKDFEKRAILDFLSDVDVFKYGWKEHSTRELNAFKEIATLAELMFNSISWTSEITKFKEEKLSKEFGFVPKENRILTTVVAGAVKEPILCDIIVEDCYENIKNAQKCGAEAGIDTLGVLMSKPYNRECTVMRMLSEGIFVVSDLFSALVTVRRLIQFKQAKEEALANAEMQ